MGNFNSAETKEELIEYQGNKFKKYIDRSEIQKQTKRVAEEITRDFKGKNVLIIGVLNGAFMWTADLVREIQLNDCQIEFTKIASYEGKESTGEVKSLIGLKTDVKDRHIIIVEDIVDTGKTMSVLLPNLRKQGPASVSLASLFFKKEKCVYKEVKIDYLGFEIPNDFIIGYGLDLDEYARNLADVWVIAQNQ